MVAPRRGLNVRGIGFVRDLEVNSLSINGHRAEFDRPGQDFYLAIDGGSDSYGGHSWNLPLATMSAVFALLNSGDTIHFVGKVREQLVTPLQVFDVTIRGEGNRPRHADDAPVPTGGQATSTWTTPASGSTNTPLLKVMQQGWRLENFVMAGHATNACVLLFRDGGAGDLERDASHFESVGMRYASGRDGIEQSGGCYNVGIYESTFHDLTGYAIKHTAGAGINDPYRWQIKRNRFAGCGNWMGVWNAHQFEIHDNVIAEITTLLLNTSGGSGHNSILRNAFDIAAVDFDPVGNVVGHATDVWSNTLKDAIETGLPAN